MRHFIDDIDSAIELNKDGIFTRSVLEVCKSLLLGEFMFDKDGTVIPKRKPEVGDSWLSLITFKGNLEPDLIVDELEDVYDEE